jgi:hypothetical protein
VLAGLMTLRFLHARPLPDLISGLRRVPWRSPRFARVPLLPSLQRQLLFFGGLVIVSHQ